MGKLFCLNNIKLFLKCQKKPNKENDSLVASISQNPDLPGSPGLLDSGYDAHQGGVQGSHQVHDDSLVTCCKLWTSHLRIQR